MIKYNNNTINKLAANATVKMMYYGGDVVYLAVKGEEPPTPPTPSGNCYEVIQTPISQYASTTYDSVYSFADLKWYMKNNLNQYEEYGIYETGTSLSDFTYYPNKLVVIGETEYQYQENDWVEVGEYIEAQTTYEVTDDPTALQGNELPTTFKIPKADVKALDGFLDLRINTENGDGLHITTDFYNYEGGEIYEGTVTKDGKYYYYSLPSEAPSSIVIQETEYMNPDPIHLIFGSKQASVEYAEKEMPLNQVYSTVAEMEAITCPDVGISQYGVVGNNLYQFEESEGWVNKAKNSLKFVAKYNNGNANVIECNTSNELSSGDTQPSYLSKDEMTEAYIGNCLTSIGDFAFDYCTNLTSVTIPNSVTSIGDGAFNNCYNLTSVNIPNGVTSIGQSAFSNCRSLTSISIPSGVTSINYDVFFVCTSLTSVTIPNSVTSIGGSAFAHCYNLTSVGVVGSGASVEIPNSVTSISDFAFSSCSGLTSVTIPDSVTSIGNYAFYYCSGLTSVTANATTPPTLGSNAFNNTNNNLVIYVPSTSVDAYKSASGWSTYASRIQAIP